MVENSINTTTFQQPQLSMEEKKFMLCAISALGKRVFTQEERTSLSPKRSVSPYKEGAVPACVCLSTMEVGARLVCMQKSRPIGPGRPPSRSIL